MKDKLIESVKKNLDILCNQIGNRHVGSKGNRDATDFFAETMWSYGFEVETQEFDCIDWEFGKVELTAGAESFPALVSPYSIPFDGKGKLISASSVEELENKNFTGEILLIHDDLAKEQLMPKNFVFYNPDEHKKIYSLLEAGNPSAIITATGKNPGLAGSMYPFPMIEDGDFDIPSVYMKDIDGVNLLKHVGETIYMKFDSERIPAKGCNVIARKPGNSGKKIVFCAHIDAKKDAPGALDNGTGVAALMGLAELLKNLSSRHTIEIVALNGEDYYSAPGQMVYLRENQGKFEDILFAVNVDGAGHFEADTAFSFYECPDELSGEVRNLISKAPQTIENDPWPQGDHMVFVMNGVPAVAVTSSNFVWLCEEITHTQNDKTDLVDCGKIADLAKLLKELVMII